MSQPLLPCYAEWRDRNLGCLGLRETAEHPPERLLHALWHHQRLIRDRLHTLDGQPLRVVHPGFRNFEGGPDFRQAVLQFGSDPYQVGDVEIDLSPGLWRAHGHHQNPSYANVILHVVWDCAGTQTSLRTIALKDYIDSPLPELRRWLGTDSAREWPPGLSGQCCQFLLQMPDTGLADLLQQAGRVRLEAKAAQIQARARQAGWEQALWEGLFRALGYKHNAWPMQRIAELIPLLRSRAIADSFSCLDWQARLFGVSGLLPPDLSPAQIKAAPYLARIWERWWREQHALQDIIVPKNAWRIHSLRPANHPQRRLALAAHWISNEELLPNLESWFLKDLPPAEWATALLRVFEVEDDEFWSWHWTFYSRKHKAKVPLLGLARTTDLATNIILPWFWIRAVTGKNPTAQARAEQRYFSWSRAEDNALLRLAKQRLLGGIRTRLLNTAARQQGLIQIGRDFCDHSNATCSHCTFPELLQSL